jgi:hypothetical protein
MELENEEQMKKEWEKILKTPALSYFNEDGTRKFNGVEFAPQFIKR